MAELSAPLILASSSPRRREILATLGFDFEIVPSQIAESRRPGERAEAYVRRLAEDKARDVAHRSRARAPSPFVLGADTTVVRGEDIFEKPRDDADAHRMIALLSGGTHVVITGVSVARAPEGVLATIAARTEVTFRRLSDAEVAGYVASGEGRDKAGAYGIQGLGSGLVTSLDGGYFNVVGLPAAEVVGLLGEVGALLRWP